MSMSFWKLPLLLIGIAALGVLSAGQAIAQCCAPPPTCCAPPTPPPPPSHICCHQVNIPSVNVNVGATVVVNAFSQSTALASASSRAGAQVFYGGGGGIWSVGEGSQGMIQNLQVDGGREKRRVAYQASRTKVKLVVIQAVCIDDRESPHPASQVSPDRDIGEGYDGELYRCIAGTHLQATIADYDGRISFDHGRTMSCAKNESLYRSASGDVACRPQKPARDCNERSLLRRFGAGVKIVKIITTETYTAYREELVQTAASSAFSMSLDGGVGGMVR
jgi:hypothetical protein